MHTSDAVALETICRASPIKVLSVSRGGPDTYKTYIIIYIYMYIYTGTVDGPPPFRLRRKPFCVLCVLCCCRGIFFWFLFLFFYFTEHTRTMATLNRYKRSSWSDGGGGRSEGKKHCDLTYCLPLYETTVFLNDRIYGGSGSAATRHLKINGRRSNQTSIRCPGQIFGGSTAPVRIYLFSFSRSHSLSLPHDPRSLATIVPIYMHR